MSHDPPVLCGPPVLRFRGCQPGLKTCGSHAVVRHPIYASYLLIQSGYVLQSLSLRNLAVVTFASACTIARALARIRLLAWSPASLTYRERARWRLIPYQRDLRGWQRPGQFSRQRRTPAAR